MSHNGRSRVACAQPYLLQLDSPPCPAQETPRCLRMPPGAGTQHADEITMAFCQHKCFERSYLTQQEVHLLSCREREEKSVMLPHSASQLQPRCGACRHCHPATAWSRATTIQTPRATPFSAPLPCCPPWAALSRLAQPRRLWSVNTGCSITYTADFWSQ